MPGEEPRSPAREAFDTRRVDAGGVARLQLGPRATLSLRGSATEESRDHWFGDTRERDRWHTLFGEAAFRAPSTSQVIVAGFAVERDAYRARDTADMNYAFPALGSFAEHLWSPLRWISLSTARRTPARGSLARVEGCVHDPGRHPGMGYGSATTSVPVMPFMAWPSTSQWKRYSPARVGVNRTIFEPWNIPTF